MSSVTDPAGNRRKFRYNDAGELIEATDVRGNVTHYTYNELGKIETITDGVGRTYTYQYLPGGRLEKAIHPDGKSVIFAYDNLGRVKTKTNGSGYCLNYQYDSMGRILKVSSNIDQEKKYTYDALGNIVTMTDACGNTTAYEYTLCGKLASVTDALGNRTTYEYDGADRLIYICQHGEEDVRESWYLRNPLGQVETIRDALGGEEHYRYDALGRLTEKVDRDHFCTKYHYSADGNVEHILYGDGTCVDMEYTALGQLSLIKDWLGETRIERNREGNPVRITDHAGRSVDYEWGMYGERKSVTCPDGRTMRFSYDNLMHLNELVSMVSGKADARIIYQYNHEGRLTEKSMQEGMSTSYSYNQAGQLSELIHRDTCGILDRICYQYDAMGNKIQVEKERRGLHEESGTYTYGYDALQRLISVEKDGTLLREYTYDAFGNRTGMEDYRCGRKTKSVYNTLNQLLTEEIWESCGMEDMKTFGKDFQKNYQKNFRYDKRGNLAAEYQEDRLLHGYEYNAMNRMSRAWDASGEEALYRYNGLGQRTGRNEQEYLLDLTKPYNNLLQIRENEKCQSFCWDNGIVLAEEQGTPPQYCFSDEMGSPLRVLYGTGKGDVYGYDEFGNPFDEGNKGNTAAGYIRQGEGQPFGYTGYRYDEISGTYYAQAREYLPGRGRFAGEDVIRGNGLLPMSLNRYVYCFDNPLQYVDLNGKEPGEYAVYYLNNMDGAKVFGHNAILAENADGTSDFYSFMGTGGLWDMLKNEDSLGYMGHESLTKEETEKFLETGDIDVTMAGGDNEAKNHDNYDRAIKKKIGLEEYDQIVDSAESYIKLYKEGTQGGIILENYLNSNQDAKYNLYNHNCDTVAGEILGKIDPYF